MLINFDAFANSTYFDVGGTASNQGIQTTLDEWSQYIHSVAANYTVYRFPKLSYIYDLDGILNFAWALPRYFLVGKEKYPKDYQSMMEDENLRQVILILWGRTWMYYDAFEENTRWTPVEKQTRYIDAIRNPDILNMMNDIRKRHGCTGIE